MHYAPLLHDNPAAPDVASEVVSTLHMHLKESLMAVADGPAEDRGVRIGERVAADFIAGRKGDHFRDGSIHYSKPKLPGYWQPTPPRTDMLEAWLGSLDTVVLHRLVRADGPDDLTSYDYARDYNEVKRYGDSIAPRRSSEETQLAYFFNSNSATTVGNALIRYLKAHPLDLRATARVFGVMHGAMTDAVITCWRLKRDVGFWRPREAITSAADDGNPATTPQPGWSSLLQPEPPYSDYVSGHGCLTAPATETIRLTFGEETPLHLVSTNPNAPGQGTGLRLPQRHRDRRPQLADLGRAALPRRDGGRLRHRPRDRPEGDAPSFPEIGRNQILLLSLMLVRQAAGAVCSVNGGTIGGSACAMPCPGAARAISAKPQGKASHHVPHIHALARPHHRGPYRRQSGAHRSPGQRHRWGR